MSARSKTDLPNTPITRADIEAKFGELRADVREREQAAKTPAVAIAVGAVVVSVVLAYWFGRRKGKKRQMVLEIRRL